MRLYDRLNDVYELPEMPVIDGTAIARQIDQLPDLPDGENLPASFYGRVAPPFPEFWVEATTYLAGGVMVQRGGWVRVMEDSAARQIAHNAKQSRLVNEFPFDEMKWGVTVMCFQYQVGVGLGVCQGNLFYWIDEQGNFLSKRGIVHRTELLHRAQRTMMEAGLLLLPSEFAPPFTAFCLKTVGALHNKGRAEKIVPSRQERRAHERKHSKPLTEYYVLKVKDVVIKTMSDAKLIGTPPDDNNPKQRRHGVHGHFRHYGEKGMFGNPLYAYKTVWIPDHERGDDSLGRIKKDYEV